MRIEVFKNLGARATQAYAVVSDIMRWPEVISSVEGVELLGDHPFRVGTRFRVQRVMFGHPTTEELEIIEIERPRRLRFGARSRDLDYERDHIVDGTQTGSRLTLIFGPKPRDETGRAALPLITPFMEINLRDELEQDLDDLAAAIAAKSLIKPDPVGRL